MNYYPHHIGDYAKDTAHLSMVEDGAYRRMLDLYYSTELPLTAEKAKLYRLLRAQSKVEREAVDTLLSEYFTLCEDGWRKTRCDAEIAKAQEKRSKAQASAEKRWHGNDDANAHANAFQESSGGNAPNPNPNPNPNPKEKRAGRGARLPAGWEPDGEGVEFCKAERPDLDPETTANRFRDYWIAQPGQKGVKLDWPATWRNWVRNEKRVNGAPLPPDYSSTIANLRD